MEGMELLFVEHENVVANELPQDVKIPKISPGAVLIETLGSTFSTVTPVLAKGLGFTLDRG